PVKASLPKVGMAHPIDAFVVARLKGLKLSLSPAAPSATLYRRLYLDLIGLPPSPKELADCERDGYEATVDRLLRSERFGEKWARPLAGRRPLLRHQWLRKGPPARTMGLARLGHRRAESRHALRPVSDRTARRRPAARCRPIPADCHRLPAQQHDQ